MANLMDDKPVVGHCPKCGGPTYGPTHIHADAIPTVLYTCSCRFQTNPQPDRPVNWQQDLIGKKPDNWTECVVGTVKETYVPGVGLVKNCILS